MAPPTSNSETDSDYNDVDYEPPVTTQILAELELTQIVRNTTLRHDIFFDAYLHFRPLTDRERGKYRTERAEEYWACLLEELEQRADRQAEHQSRLSCSYPRVQQLLAESRNILQTLVPRADVELVREVLDIPLLMQQIQRKTLDYVRLAEWFATIFKKHCAPMRDRWVDSMVANFTEASETGNAKELVQGLRELFGVLEAMKLDVANHLIRNMRPLLIKHIVEHEQRAISKKLRTGSLDIRASQKWYGNYDRYWEGLEERTELRFHERQVGVFLKGLVDLVTPSNEDPLPDTLRLDTARLRQIRSILHAKIAINICIAQTEALARKSFGYGKAISEPFAEDLRALFTSLIADQHLTEYGDLELDALSLEVIRQAQTLSRSQKLMDLDITRSLESSIREKLTVESCTWKIEEVAATEAIWEATLVQTLSFLNMPIYLVAQRSDCTTEGTATAATAATREPCGTHEGLASRLAQLASLHWQVFGPMVYLIPLDEDDDTDGYSCSDATYETSRRSSVDEDLHHNLEGLHLACPAGSSDC